MPEMKEPHRSNKLVRGGDNPIVAECGYSSNIPSMAVQALEQEVAGLMHGVVSLTLHVKDGNLIRYTTNRERSYVPGKPTTGSGQ